MEIKGKIEKKEMTAGQKADGSAWTRASFVIDGKSLSTFDKKIIDDFNPGMFVKVETKAVEGKDGKTYNNMLSMEKAEEGDLPIKGDINVGFSNSVEDLLRQILAELKEQGNKISDLGGNQ